MAKSEPKKAQIQISRRGKKSFVARNFATHPLKILAPKSHTNAAWIYTTTFGGGLVGGDEIDLRLHAAPETQTLLTTQSSTKIYRTNGETSWQTFSAQVDRGASLFILPDPIVCFANSCFEQSQQIDLEATANLVLLDSLTSGRHARGERWAFDRYRSRTHVRLGGKSIFRETLLLDPRDGNLAGQMRMRDVDCLATLIIVGEKFRSHSTKLLEFIASQKIDPHGSLLFAASEISGGVLIRVAGSSGEEVVHWIRERLDFVAEFLGENPWRRKW